MSGGKGAAGNDVVQKPQASRNNPNPSPELVGSLAQDAAMTNPSPESNDHARGPIWREVQSIQTQAGREDWSVDRYKAALRAALSPQTLPAPPLSTDVQSAATGFHEQDVSLKVALPAPGEVERRWYAEAPKRIWLHGIGDPIGETTWAVDPMPGGEDVEQEHAVGYIRDDFATVAAANDEGVARDLLRGSFDSAFENAKSWYTEDAAVEAMVQFAGIVREAAAKVADGYEQHTGDPAFDAATDVAAVTIAERIRLLSQGGKA